MNKKLISGLVSGILVLSFFVFPGRGLAQTTDSAIQALQAQIQALLAQIQQLQAQLATLQGGGGQGGQNEGPATGGGGVGPVVNIDPSQKFAVNDRVQSTFDLNVREVPGGKSVAIVPDHTKGTITGGPQQGGAYFWWKVNYDNGASGYSVGDFLEKIDTVGGETSGNKAPILTADAFVSPTSVGVNNSNWWRIEGTDPEGGQIIYKVDWGDGTSDTYNLASGGSVAARHTFSNTGNFQLKLTATDQAGASVFRLITVNVVNGSQTLSQPSIKFKIGDTVQTTDNLNVRTGPSGAPVGIQPVGAKATVVGGPAWSIVGGWWWSLRYESGVSGWSAEDWLVKQGASLVTPTSTVNQSPVISGVTGPTALTVGQSGTWTVAASDPNSDVLSYSATWGDGGSNAPQSGSSFTHTYSATGTYPAIFTVNDGKGGVANSDKVITVSSATGGGGTTTSTITVTSPIAGEVWREGETHTVRWTAPASVMNVGFDLNSGGGGVVISPTNNPNSGSYSFTVPSNLGTNYGRSDFRLRVFDNNNSTNYADSAPFTILAAVGNGGTTTSTITVTSPIAGEIWREGETHTVRWTAPASVKIGIRLNFGSGGVFSPVSDNNSNTGYYSFTVSSVASNVGRSDFSLRVFDSDNSANYADSAPFSILAAVGNGGTTTSTITVTSPIAGEIWREGETHTVRWTAPASIQSVLILLKLPPYTSVIKYINPFGVPNTGSYSFTVPSNLGTNYGRSDFKIHVWDWNNENLLTGFSAPFTILAATSTANQPPVISGVTGPTALTVGQPGTWTVAASDPNSDVLSYSATWGDGGSNAPQSGSSFTHTYSTTGTYTATFTVNDGKGGVANSDKAVTVSSTATSTASQPPVLTADAFVSPTSVGVNNSNWWRLEGTDPEGGSITYKVDWGDGTSNTYTLASGASTPAYHTFSVTGNFQLKLTATDQAGASVSRFLTVGVVGTPAASVLSSIGSQLNWISVLLNQIMGQIGQ